MRTRTFKERHLSLSPLLYRIAYSILRNAEDAEDAVQDTFLRLFEESDKLDEMERPQAYFTVTVRNISLNKLRARHPETAEDETAGMPADRGSDDRMEARDELRHILASLPAHERRILILRHVSGCSFADIAQLTGRTESSIRMLLSRVRRRLHDSG